MAIVLFLVAVTPAMAQPQSAAVNPVTGAPFPSPFQALGNVLRGQNPPPTPPSTQVGQPPLPTAIPPTTYGQSPAPRRGP